MPKHAKVLCVQNQFALTCIWAIVDPTAEIEQRNFRWFGTGHPMPESPLHYVGTVQINGGELIFHLFQEL
jgi:hypothetical protein